MKFTSRRAVFAFGVAVATIAAPAMATFAGTAPTIAPRILADCTTVSSPGNDALDCEPASVTDFGGAPSEMDLTDTNPGIASPSHDR